MPDTGAQLGHGRDAMCAGIDKTNRTDSFAAGVGEPKTGSGDIREL
jgi:hypothetical protein